MQSLNIRRWQTPTAATFSVLPTLAGYDVVDDPTGHAVAFAESRDEADGIVADLREAALNGCNRLAAALGCPMDEEDE
jgi:hypothetical protein